MRRRPMSRKIADALAACGFGVGLVILVLAFGLAGCQSPGAIEPKVVVTEVKIPVPVSCVGKDFPKAPASYADDTMASTPGERYRQTAQANQQRKARLAVAEPVLSGCRAAP